MNVKRNIAPDIIDKTSNCKRLERVQDKTKEEYQVPHKSEVVECIYNIRPTYTHTGEGLVLCHSRNHFQGTIFWSTVTTYELKGTAVYPQQPVQVHAQVRNLQKPYYLAKCKIKKTTYSNVQRGWAPRYEWNHEIFYPKVGTSILKTRKFPLDRKPTYVLGHRAGVSGPRRTRSVFGNKVVLDYLKEYWAQDLTPKEVTDSRPQDKEYLAATNWGEYGNRGRYRMTPWIRGCESGYVERNNYAERIPPTSTGLFTDNSTSSDSSTSASSDSSTSTSSDSDTSSDEEEPKSLRPTKRARKSTSTQF